jgi:C4-dicarboxylate transporter, DctM subunit
MDPLLIAVLGTIGMFVLIALHIPIGIAMALAGVIGFTFLVGWAPAVALLANGPVSVLSNMDLAVIPLFLLMGSFAGVGGLSADIYRIAPAGWRSRPYSAAPVSARSAAPRSRPRPPWAGSRSRKC